MLSLCRRGLSAARDLKLGDRILRVPEKALMNGRSARKDMEFAQALSCYPSLSDVQVRYFFALLHTVLILQN